MMISLQTNITLLRTYRRSVNTLAQRQKKRRANPNIIYKDRQILVLDKPPGLVTQGTHAEDKRKQYDSIEPLMRNLVERLDLSSAPVSVHRLDKPTTGCLLLALTSPSATSLSQQFLQGTVGKTYLALVHGGSRDFNGRTGGKIESGWKIDDEGRPSVCPINERGCKPALSEWSLVASSRTRPLSLLKLTLKTGLKHQLRLHTSSILRAPIVGDWLYTNEDRSRDITRTEQDLNVPRGRLFLHSWQVALDRYSLRELPTPIRDAPPAAESSTMSTSTTKAKTFGKAKRLRLTLRAPLPKDFVGLCRKAGLVVPDEYLHGGVDVEGETRGGRGEDIRIDELDGEYFGGGGGWLLV